LDARLALHDLGDPTPGYPELNAIEFMRLRVQFWQTQRIELEQASFVRVTSLTPQTWFDRKSSWEFDVGATTIKDRACDACLMAHATGGAGLTFAAASNRLSVFALAYGTFGWAPGIAGLRDTHLRFGLGPSGGVRARLSDGIIILARAHWLYLPGQSPAMTYRVDGTLRISVFASWALGVEARYVPNGLEGQALAYAYF
jgi:hypothetical protein